MSTRVAVLMRSIERCVVVPIPDDAYERLSLRARPTSSCRLFAGTAGLTVMMFGVLGPRITGEKSVNGS